MWTFLTVRMWPNLKYYRKLFYAKLFSQEWLGIQGGMVPLLTRGPATVGSITQCGTYTTW